MSIFHHYTNPPAPSPYLMASREDGGSIRSAKDNPAETSIRLAGINGQHSHMYTHTHAQSSGCRALLVEREGKGKGRGGAESLCSTRLISEALFVSLVRAEEE